MPGKFKIILSDFHLSGGCLDGGNPLEDFGSDQEFEAFLERGGMLAWGIVPVTSELIAKENVQTLVERLEKGISLFVRNGVDEGLLVSSSWLMPSCDTVMMTPENSDLAFKMTKEISDIMRSKYGFEY